MFAYVLHLSSLNTLVNHNKRCLSISRRPKYANLGLRGYTGHGEYTGTMEKENCGNQHELPYCLQLMLILGKRPRIHRQFHPKKQEIHSLSTLSPNSCASTKSTTLPRVNYMNLPLILYDTSPTVNSSIAVQICNQGAACADCMTDDFD